MSGVNEDETVTSCVMGCGMRGSPGMLNMCAECFVEQDRRSDASLVQVSTISNDVVEVHKEIEIVTTEVHIYEIEVPVEETASEDTTTTTATTMVTTTSTTMSTFPKKPSAEPVRREQKNRSRCFDCKRKVGLLGFRCRCEYTYCSRHRLPEAHQCDFDHGLFGRTLLEQTNPVVIAPKLQKI